jgi:Na+-driven multidrug efflux pump
MAGPAAAWIATATLSSLLMTRALWGGRLGFRPALFGIKLQRRLFWEILRVGLVSSFSAVTSNVTAMLVTGLVGRFGVAALAGYGIGVRLEFMLVPLAFGVGAALTTMVGIAAGAGDWRRAVRAAWFGALLAGGVIGVIGWIVAFFPAEWAGVFSKDPEVIATTVSYITRVAPFFFLFGVGMTLSFASQGAGRMLPPFTAGVARMIVATAGGYIAVELLGGGLASVFTAIAAGMITFGGLIAAPLVIRPWRGRSGVVAA